MGFLVLFFESVGGLGFGGFGRPKGSRLHLRTDRGFDSRPVCAIPHNPDESPDFFFLGFTVMEHCESNFACKCSLASGCKYSCSASVRGRGLHLRRPLSRYLAGQSPSFHRVGLLL